MKIRKVLFSMLSGFVVGTVVGLLFHPVKDSGERKNSSQVTTEFVGEGAEQIRSYSIL